MSPYERLIGLYAAHPTVHPFEWYWDWHCRHAFACATPEFAMAFRPVCRESEPGQVSDPTCLFPPDKCDAWFVFCGAGHLRRAWRAMPWELPWIGYERLQGDILELQWHPTGLLRRLLPPQLEHELAQSARWLG